MKKISVMLVVVLFSAIVFANGASLPKGKTTVNGNKPKTEMKKEHKQKDKKKMPLKTKNRLKRNLKKKLKSKFV